MAAKLELGPFARVHGIAPEIVIALQVALGVADRLGIPKITITSASDRTHSPGSLHYQGKAVDLVVEGDIGFSVELSKALGPDFDVIFEGSHTHLEFQPKRPLNL